MVVADITVWMIILAFFNYFVVYKRNKFLGSIGYLLFGVLMYGIRTEFGYSQAVYGYIAMFIMLSAIVNIIFEVLPMLSNRKLK